MYMVELPETVDELYNAMQELPAFKDESLSTAFQGFAQKMEQIKRFYDVKKYRIVFIGEPGKGKTTAICNWLNLLKSEKIGEKSITSIPLLATAAGRTTVAEVHIRQVEKNSCLRMEYIGQKEQEEYIREYCSYYYNHEKPDQYCEEDEEDRQNPNSASVHSEIDRVVRNMAGLDNWPDSSERIESIEKKQKILDFLGRFESEELFYSYVLEKINLSERQIPEIVYDGSEPFERWLPRRFREVNHGKNPNASIARKIYVDISMQDLDMGLPDFVDEVIDTIGLESTVRPDLHELMFAEDTICFVIDEMRSVPSSNVKTLLKETYLSSWDEYCVNKTAIFVRSPLDELAAVNEADGDAEEGKAIKYDELSRRVKADNVRYCMENTLFADACAAYTLTKQTVIQTDPKTGEVLLNKRTGKPRTKQENRISAYDDQCAEDFQFEVTEKLESIIDMLKKQLEQNAEEIRHQVAILVQHEKEKADKEAANELRALRKKLEQKKVGLLPRFRTMALTNAVVEKAIVQIHWSTVRKMNSLCGAYNQWHTDIYHQIMQVGRECFAAVVAPVCKEMKVNLIDVRSETARNMTDGYIKSMEAKEKELTQRMGQQFMLWALDDKFAPQVLSNPFWKNVNGIFGRGYKRRVADNYYRFICGDDEKLVKMIEEGVTELMDGVIQMLPADN